MTLQHVNNFLAESPTSKLAMGSAVNRIDAAHGRAESFEQGVIDGYQFNRNSRYNVYEAIGGQDFAKMGADEWHRAINNKTMGAWREDLTSDVLTLVGTLATAPLLLARTATSFAALSTSTKVGMGIGAVSNYGASWAFDKDDNFTVEEQLVSLSAGALGGGLGSKVASYGGRTILGAAFGSFSADFTTQGYYKITDKTAFNFGQLGLATGLGALGQKGVNLFNSKISTQLGSYLPSLALKEYIPSGLAGALSAKNALRTIDNITNSSLSVGINFINSGVVATYNYATDSFDPRLSEQFNRSNDFSGAHNSKMNTSHFESSWLNRAYINRTGTR